MKESWHSMLVGNAVNVAAVGVGALCIPKSAVFCVVFGFVGIFMLASKDVFLDGMSHFAIGGIIGHVFSQLGLRIHPAAMVLVGLGVVTLGYLGQRIQLQSTPSFVAVVALTVGTPIGVRNGLFPTWSCLFPIGMSSLLAASFVNSTHPLALSLAIEWIFGAAVLTHSLT